jgi:hypothetical protein
MCKGKVALCSDTRTKHSMQSEGHVEFFNIKANERHRGTMTCLQSLRYNLFVKYVGRYRLLYCLYKYYGRIFTTGSLYYFYFVSFCRFLSYLLFVMLIMPLFVHKNGISSGKSMQSRKVVYSQTA